MTVDNSGTFRSFRPPPYMLTFAQDCLHVITSHPSMDSFSISILTFPQVVLLRPWELNQSPGSFGKQMTYCMLPSSQRWEWKYKYGQSFRINSKSRRRRGVQVQPDYQTTFLLPLLPHLIERHYPLRCFFALHTVILQRKWIVAPAPRQCLGKKVNPRLSNEYGGLAVVAVTRR